MGLQLWHQPGTLSLEFPLELPSIILSVVYTLLFLWMLFRCRANFKSLSWKAWLLFGLTLLLVLPAYSALILQRTEAGMLPASPVGVLPSEAMISLLGFALVMMVAAWLGPGPGLVANLVAGLAWARFYPLIYTDLLAFSAWGFAVGVCLHQPYKGELFNALRHPLIALPVSALLPMFFLSISRLAANMPPGGLLAVDYIVAIWDNEIPLWMLSAVILGGFLELLFRNPRWRPVQRADKVSLYNRSLRARLLIITIPLVLLGVILSVVAVTASAVTLAREQSLAEMDRGATNAAEGITHFYYTGQNLLKTFAADPLLLDPDPQQRTRVLEIDRQVVAFFQELLFVDQDLQIADAVPAAAMTQGLTAEEGFALQQARSPVPFSQVTNLTELPAEVYGLTLVEQVFEDENVANGLPKGFLLGRVQLDINPEMQRALGALQSTRGVGAGFILDERGLIIAHPDSNFILRPWNIGENASRYALTDLKGEAYENVASEGYRVLTYILAVDGTPYRVVLQLPYSAVLETAAAISRPLLLVQIFVGLTLLIAIPYFSTRIIRPLNTLAEAANHIAQGNLAVPVDISGEDEIAQLGSSFEKMRVRLQARLNDLSLLLNIAQSVSATLDLERGVPPILEGALEETGATVARFVFLGSGDRPQRVFSVGGDDRALTELDRAFATVATRRRDLLLIRDLAQVKGSTSPTGGLQSVAIFPVRTQNSTVAVLWVGANELDAFDEARVNFLTTLASQAAVLADNARLFQAAEGGRRRLAAILASTTDGVLVTDSEVRLLLINPAAQRLLVLDESAYGRPLDALEMPESLTSALTRTDGEQQPPAVEVPLEDGRTFYASIAPIMGTEGGILGRVVVMRDITHFKELDEMKSEFVATVSHDLRAPLTFIRGYATMLMMVGELNDKQHDYLQRILEGIDQMSALIGDLLNLRRIEAGVGIRREPCRLGLVLVEAVDSMRARQAVGNLVDNAIKYTPGGGVVSVGLGLTDQEAIVRVADTGIGIAPEDQVRLFEKFYRIKRRETGNIQGTGLGLAIVRSIIERHGGRVWVESILDQGSTFCIALPLPAEPAEQPQQ